MPLRLRRDAGGREGADVHRHAAGPAPAGGLPVASGGARRRGPGPDLPRGEPYAPGRRAAPPRSARRAGRGRPRADGRGLGRALPPSRAAPAPGRGDVHPRGLPDRRGGLPAGGQCRAPPEAPAEMARLFADHPEAVARTVEIAEACGFCLSQLRYEYPDEPVPPGARRRNTWRRRPSSGRTGATAAIFPPPSRGRSARSCGSSPRWTMPVTS